jgi:hypothetical protein
MMSLVRSLSDVGTAQAWETPETGLLIRIGVAVILVVLVIGWMVDSRRRKVDEAMAVQGRVSDALMAEPEIGWTVTPLARVPLRPGSPIVLELRGSVRSPEARDAAVRTALRILVEHPHPVSFEDRLWVDSAPARLAA